MVAIEKLTPCTRTPAPRVRQGRLPLGEPFVVLPVPAQPVPHRSVDVAAVTRSRPAARTPDTEPRRRRMVLADLPGPAAAELRIEPLPRRGSAVFEALGTAFVFAVFFAAAALL